MSVPAPDRGTWQADLPTEPTAEEQRVMEQFGSVVEARASTLGTRGGDEAVPDMDGDLQSRRGTLGNR